MGTTAVSVGPANQTQIPATVHNLPSSVPPNGSVTSNLIQVEGYTKVAVGLMSSQNGMLSIQRFLDTNGAVRLGNPESVAIVAATPVSLTVNDGSIFGSFQVVVTNQAGTTALLGNVAVAVASDPTTAPGAGAGSYSTATSTSVDVPATTGGAVVLTPNPTATYRAFRNLRSNTQTIWLTLGDNPTVGGGLIDLAPGDLYEMSVDNGNLYQGTVTAISENTDQTLLVTEGV